MKIYKLRKDVNNFRSCFIEKFKLDDYLEPFNNATSLKITVNDIIISYDDEKKSPIGDIIHCWDSIFLLISKKSVDVFSKCSKINAEYIKLQDDCFIFNNLTALVDILEEKSIYKKFKEYIIDVEKYFFKKIDYLFVFQIKLSNNLVLPDYFVTDEFVKIVEENNLKGFLFEEVWNSENEMGWSDDIVNNMRSIEEYEIYKNAGLMEFEICGKKCLIRTGINWSYIDEDGYSNKERIKQGLSPLDENGKAIELHHLGQHKNSPLAELTFDEHRGKGNDTILHDKKMETEAHGEGNSWNEERKEYWIQYSFCQLRCNHH